MKRLRTSKGISDALATILLLGLVMVGVSVIALLLPRLLPSEPAPNLNLRVEVTGYQGGDALVYTHIGGQSVSVNNLKVMISTGNDFYAAEGDNLRTTSPTGIFGPNEKVYVQLQSIPPTPEGSTSRASLVHKPSGTILASATIGIPFSTPQTPGEPESYYVVYSDGPPIIPTGADIYCWAEVPRHTTSIALDSEENPHISYYINRANYHNSMYAYYDGSSWNVQQVDSVGWFGWHPSMALDSSDHPHISYGDYTALFNGYLKYAHYDGSSWQIQTVEYMGPSRGVMGAQSIALDSDDHPHIVYQRWWVRDVRYAYYNGSSWQIQTVGSNYCYYPSIAVDSSNHPHISYNYRWESLRYAYYDGSTWQIQTVESGGNYPSIAVDSSNRPHISYSGGGNLRYAYYNGSSWQIQTVDTSVGSYTSIALDSNGYPHISYQKGWVLKHAYYDGFTWHTETVDPASGAGVASSIAVDSSNHPHISYYFNRSSYKKLDLRYAHYDGSSWQIQTIDRGNDVFDAHVRDGAPEGVEYARTTNGFWAGWGVFLRWTQPVDLSAASSLRFWVKTSKNLKVEVQHQGGGKSGVYGSEFSNYWDNSRPGEWQEVTIPASEFSQSHLRNAYGVFLITQDQWTSTDFLIDNVRWVFPIRADFTYTQTGANTVQFTDRSATSQGTIDSWEWDFDDDGDPDSTEQNPVWSGAPVGTHLVKLIVRNSGGAMSKYTANVTVTGPPPISDTLIYSDAGMGSGVNPPAWFWGGGASINQSEVSPGAPGDAKSWRVQYTNAPGGWAGFYCQFSSTRDMSGYTHLSFWVKGESGGEKFAVGMKGGGIEVKIPITDYTTVTTSWQEVRIPLSEFSSQPSSVDFTFLQIPWTISFTSEYPGQDVTVYIDYIRFVRDTSVPGG